MRMRQPTVGRERAQRSVIFKEKIVYDRAALVPHFMQIDELLSSSQLLHRTSHCSAKIHVANFFPHHVVQKNENPERQHATHKLSDKVDKRGLKDIQVFLHTAITSTHHYHNAMFSTIVLLHIQKNCAFGESL